MLAHIGVFGLGRNPIDIVMCIFVLEIAFLTKHFDSIAGSIVLVSTTKVQVHRCLRTLPAADARRRLSLLHHHRWPVHLWCQTDQLTTLGAHNVR